MRRRDLSLSSTMLSARPEGWDAIVVATDHDAIDWAAAAAKTKLVIDTRNVYSRFPSSGARVVKA